ncbi:heme-binding protein [Actinocorallia longicatena]|uniref:Heme-binding protein n=1 Tax=Actinocorallia longicatena TaxID=111803 RepID=A0ABP6QJA3_9ACTN
MKKIIATAAAGLALTAGGAAMMSTSASAAVDPKIVQQGSALTADAAIKVADAVQKAAVKEKQRVSVAIVDRSGAVKIIVRGDGSGPQTEESAKRKAFTAVSFGKTTKELAGGVGGQGATLRDIPGTLFLGGGVPVASGNTPIAGIGVAGAPSGDIDDKLAQEGLKAIEKGLN